MRCKLSLPPSVDAGEMAPGARCGTVRCRVVRRGVVRCGAVRCWAGGEFGGVASDGRRQRQRRRPPSPDTVHAVHAVNAATATSSIDVMLMSGLARAGVERCRLSVSVKVDGWRSGGVGRNIRAGVVLLRLEHDRPVQAAILQDEHLRESNAPASGTAPCRSRKRCQKVMLEPKFSPARRTAVTARRPAATIRGRRMVRQSSMQAKAHWNEAWRG